MENLTREILAQILKEDWVWDKGTPKKPRPPELKYDLIRKVLENMKENMYYDEVMFPLYHRFIRKLHALVQDTDWNDVEEYKDMHFEEIDGNMFFGSDCPECQNRLDMRLDRIFYNYLENHPEWRQEYPTDEEIDSMNPKLPTHQKSLF